MLVQEVTKANLLGYMAHECVYKRLYWHDDNQNRFFTYQSSVPDEIYKESSSDISSRFDILHQITCFRGVCSNDLLVEQVFQVDFRQLHSKHLLE